MARAKYHPTPIAQKSNTPSIVAGIVLIAIVVTVALVYVETRPATPGPSAFPLPVVSAEI